MVTPPKFLESLVRRLLPPAVREQVLGDLHERYESPLKYIADAASVVPAAIFGQLRRSTPIPVRVLEALIIYGSVFVAGRLLSALMSELYVPPGASQAAHLTMIAMAGLVWHDIYYVRPPESELSLALKQDFSWLKWFLQRPFRDVLSAMFWPCLVLTTIAPHWHRFDSLLNLPDNSNPLGLFMASTLISSLRKRIEKRHPSVGA
jgi:hypothetical protein